MTLALTIEGFLPEVAVAGFEHYAQQGEAFARREVGDGGGLGNEVRGAHGGRG